VRRGAALAGPCGFLAGKSSATEAMSKQHRKQDDDDGGDGDDCGVPFLSRSSRVPRALGTYVRDDGGQEQRVKAFTCVNDAAGAAGSAALAAAIAAGASLADATRVSRAASSAVLALQKCYMVWVPAQVSAAAATSAPGLCGPTECACHAPARPRHHESYARVDGIAPSTPASGLAASSPFMLARKRRRPPLRERRRRGSAKRGT